MTIHTVPVSSRGGHDIVSVPSSRSRASLRWIMALGVAFSTLGVVSAAAADEFVVTLTLSNHVFTPSEVKVPANRPLTVVVKNEDDAAEEFDSKDLKIEKVIAAKSTGTFRVKPLKPGSYPFSGEYHEATAHGVMTAE